MLKAFIHSRFAIRHSQCLVFPTNLINQKLVFYRRRDFSRHIQISNEIRSTAFHFKTPTYSNGICNLRSFCTNDVEDADENVGLELEESEDADGCVSHLKDFLYDHLNDDLLAKITSCSSEQEVIMAFNLMKLRE